MQNTLIERAPDAFPSTTENNPREWVQAITLMSGKQLGEAKESVQDEVRIKINSEEVPKQQKDEGLKEEEE